MSKRKKRSKKKSSKPSASSANAKGTAASKPSPKPSSSAPKTAAPKPSPKQKSKRKPKGKRSRSRKKSKQSNLPLIIGGVAALVLLIGGGYWFMTRNSNDVVTPQFDESDLGEFTIGRTVDCQGIPSFLADRGIEEFVIDAGNPDTYVGLVIRQMNGEIYQDPSWRETGDVAAQTRDREGNIYVIPHPSVSLENNLPEEQNTLYRIDSATGDIAEYMQLPWVRPPSDTNPFGLMGIGYDCDTDSMYVSSVAGSTWREEAGRIYRIDLKRGEIVDQLDGVDVLGLTTYNGVNGKRLYYGLARSPQVMSIQLNANGNFYGEPRPEFSLAEQEMGNVMSAMTLRVMITGQMKVREANFNYRPASESNPWKKEYLFDYGQDTDQWTLIDIRADDS